jgi:hypothetical protein
MMRVGTIIPQSLRVETEPYSRGWEIIKNSDGNSVDRDVRRGDWNFFFLAANIQATAMGYWGERTVRRAMERVLAKAAPSKFNGLEITGVSAKQFLGLPYVQSLPNLRELESRRAALPSPTFQMRRNISWGVQDINVVGSRYQLRHIDRTAMRARPFSALGTPI